METEQKNKYFEKFFEKYKKPNPISEEQKELFLKNYAEFEPVPFDIIGFAKQLKVHVELVDTLEYTQSGKIEHKEGQFFISLNNNHAPTRSVFTLAHEIAHFFFDIDSLKGKGQIMDEKLYRDQQPAPGKNGREVRANRFAAELLMPTEPFTLACKNIPMIYDVAAKFRVSTEAVAVRMVGLFPNQINI